MQTEVVLITGVNGEIGHGLTAHLGEAGGLPIVALDLKPLDPALEPHIHAFYQGDILDADLLEEIDSTFRLRTIYHLASILSTRAEHDPEIAHRVNVQGSVNLLELAIRQSRQQGVPVKFLYPSSIAVYGLPDLNRKSHAGKVKEDDWCLPTTMYGCNKLACEHLGRYYANHYRQLETDESSVKIDFRSLRLPGLISAITVPTGGTSDYGPEMLHHAAQGFPYTCFVRPDTCLPFMAMPDAVKALVALEAATRERLTRCVYNVTSFSLSAEEIHEQVKKAFPKAQIGYKPTPGRQRIVDSWPADVDDNAARTDWDWKPDFDLERAFSEYLIPNIAERYGARV